MEEMALFVYGRRGKHKYFSLYEKSSTYIYHSRTNPLLVQGIQVILSPDVYHIFPIPCLFTPLEGMVVPPGEIALTHPDCRDTLQGH